MDAITMLRDDHRQVEKLFRQVERTKDPMELTDLGPAIIELLSRHAAIEEQVFYPSVERAAPETTDLVLKSLEAHHAAKTLLAEVDRTPPTSDRYRAKLLVIVDSVRSHVGEEEQEIFPALRRHVGRRDLNDIGDLLEQARRVAPTKPHPHAPDTPPGNFGNLVFAIVDRARTAAETVARSATKRSIARSQGDDESAGEDGRSATKKAATTTRKAATRTAKKATQSTRGTAEKAARATRQTAKATRTTGARAAKKATQSTRGTAKKATQSTRGTAKKATRSTRGTAEKATGATRQTAKATRTTGTRPAKKRAR